MSKTLTDEIITIVKSEANNNPAPTRCTITKVYSDGHADVSFDRGSLNYVEVIGTAEVGDVAAVLWLDESMSDYIVIDGGSVDVAGKEDKANKVASWSGTTDNVHYPGEKLVKDSLDGKVDKVANKKLSSNDFTDSYKSSLDNLKTVATSGSYNDLTDKPSIPSSSSDLSDGSSIIKTNNTVGLIKNDGSIDTTQYISQHQSLDNYVQKSQTAGLLKSDGSVDTNTYLTQHQSLTDYVQKSNGANTMTDSSAYGNLETSENATQKQINNAINTKIGAIMTALGNCENLLGGS